MFRCYINSFLLVNNNICLISLIFLFLIVQTLSAISILMFMFSVTGKAWKFLEACVNEGMSLSML